MTLESIESQIQELKSQLKEMDLGVIVKKFPNYPKPLEIKRENELFNIPKINLIHNLEEERQIIIQSSLSKPNIMPTQTNQFGEIQKNISPLLLIVGIIAAVIILK